MAEPLTGTKRRMRAADRDAKAGKRAPIRNEKGQFLKVNPGGGRKKEPFGPMTLEELTAMAPNLLGEVYELGMAGNEKMLRLGLAYGLGQPVSRSVSANTDASAIGTLTRAALEQLVGLGKRVEQLESGETLVLEPGEFLEGSAVLVTEEATLPVEVDAPQT